MNIVKYGLSLVVIIICSIIIYQGAQIALADISHYPVKSAISKNTANTPLSLEELASLEEKIQYSIKLRPNNGEYREYLGRIYYLKAQHNYDDYPLFIKDIKLAFDSHRKASQLRPQWPYSWANMALMKSHLQQFDAGFIHSVNQAIKYGPWEISSNQAIVQAGFTGWGRLSRQMQIKITAALERIYLQQPHQAKTLLIEYKMAAELCPQLQTVKFLEDKICS